MLADQGDAIEYLINRLLCLVSYPLSQAIIVIIELTLTLPPTAAPNLVCNDFRHQHCTIIVSPVRCNGPEMVHDNSQLNTAPCCFQRLVLQCIRDANQAPLGQHLRCVRSADPGGRQRGGHHREHVQIVLQPCVSFNLNGPILILISGKVKVHCTWGNFQQIIVKFLRTSASAFYGRHSLDFLSAVSFQLPVN